MSSYSSKTSHTSQSSYKSRAHPTLISESPPRNQDSQSSNTTSVLLRKSNGKYPRLAKILREPVGIATNDTLPSTFDRSRRTRTSEQLGLDTRGERDGRGIGRLFRKSIKEQEEKKKSVSFRGGWGGDEDMGNVQRYNTGSKSIGSRFSGRRRRGVKELFGSRASPKSNNGNNKACSGAFGRMATRTSFQPLRSIDEESEDIKGYEAVYESGRFRHINNKHNHYPTTDEISQIRGYETVYERGSFQETRNRRFNYPTTDEISGIEGYETVYE